MPVSEFDYRTEDQIYADELKYRNINPFYGKEEDRDECLNADQLRSLNILINIAQQECASWWDITMKDLVLQTYQVDKLEDIKQGVYKDRVVSFCLLAFFDLWMTIPEKRGYPPAGES